MKTLRIEGVWIAKAPIHHGGDEKTGSETMLRRMKFIVGNKILEIPYISGNAIRGVLRRLAVQDLLERVSYRIKEMRLYHALFSGGVLESVEEEGIIDLELRKRIRNLLIPISLFGFAYKNQVLEGKLVVSHALPFCKELNEYLPQSSSVSIYELLDWEFATRKEEIRSSEEKPEQPVQMIYRYEVFIPGTRFYHYFVLMDTTEVEEAFFHHLLRLWAERPFVAGRSASGLGKIEFSYRHSLPDPRIYLEFVEEKKDEIVALLQELDS